MHGWMDGWEGGTYYGVSPADLGENKVGLPEEETGEQGRRRRKSRVAHQQRHLTQLRARAHTHKQSGREKEEELHSFQW